VSFNGDSSHPSLFISQGSLSLNGNSFTINNSSGTPLGSGSYTLIQQASGNVSSSGNFAVNLVGNGSVAGCIASIAVIGGNVDLVVQAPATFSGLTGSQSIAYGAGFIPLNGTLSAAGPIYPAMGETVTALINGNSQNGVVYDGTGDFSISFNPSMIPAAGAPYSISYLYGGDALLVGSTNTSTTLTVNPLPVALAGVRPYDGTATAAANILTVTNLVGADVVNVVSGSAMLAGASVGLQPLISLGTLALGGPAAGNYTLSGASGTVAVVVPPFQITSEGVDATGTNVVIVWQSAPGGVYQVLGSTNIASSLNNWINVGPPVTATTTTTSATIPVTASEYFFDIFAH